jgi:hypothetical protein
VNISQIIVPFSETVTGLDYSSATGVLSLTANYMIPQAGTTTQIPYMNTGGTGYLYSANLTFDGSLLNLTGNMGIGQAAVTTMGLGVTEVMTGSSSSLVIGAGVLVTNSQTGTNTTAGLFGSATSTKRNGTGSVSVLQIMGLDFSAQYIPSSALQNNCTVSVLQGVRSNLVVTGQASEAKNCTVTNAIGFKPTAVFTTGASSSGAMTIATLAEFSTVNPTLTTGSGGSTPTITTLYGFYDAGLTVGGINWGCAINTQSYFNANVSIGKNTAPTVALDVVGQITADNIVTGTYFQTSTAITANSSGTVAIVAKDANLLTNNAGWLPCKKSDGTVVYLPYWT